MICEGWLASAGCNNSQNLLNAMGKVYMSSSRLKYTDEKITVFRNRSFFKICSKAEWLSWTRLNITRCLQAIIIFQSTTVHAVINILLVHKKWKEFCFFYFKDVFAVFMFKKRIYVAIYFMRQNVINLRLLCGILWI